MVTRPAATAIVSPGNPMTRLTNVLPVGLVKTQTSPRLGRALGTSSTQILSPGASVGDIDPVGTENSRKEVAYETALKADQAPIASAGINSSSQRRRIPRLDGVSAI